MTVNVWFFVDLIQMKSVPSVVSSGTENAPNGIEISKNRCSLTTTTVSKAGRGV